MPNPVAVNDLSPISGSLQTSRVSYGVETAGKNYGQNYNSTNWYSDIPNNGQFYTIISDNYTANYYVSRSNAGGAYVEGGLPAVDDYSAPVFWITAGTSSLDVITIVNGLPDRIGQVPFNSGSQALNWVASSSNYFAVGPDYYQQIDADNLRLYLDANQIISYPTTQSTWYDLSGYTKNGILENGLGTSWNSNGWFDFDGSDDDVNLGVTNTLYSGSNVSWEVLFNSDSTTGYRALFGNANTAPPYVALHLSTGTMGLRWEVSVTAGTYVDSVLATATINRWQHFVVTYDGSIFRTYLNGVATGTVSWTQGLGNNTQTFYIGRFWAGLFNGLMEKFRIYQKTLSAADAAQNYYGGPIVTDGLVFAVDAGNLVSYPKSGTSWYNLTGSVDGTLTNGPTFSPADGGELIFDGTDDYIDFGNPGSLFNPATSTMTMMGWIYVKNNQSNILIGLQESGAGSLSLGTNSSGNVRFICRPTAGSQGTIDSSATLALNTWYHIAMTKDTANSISDCTLWINGSPVNTASSTVNFPTSTAAIRSAYYFDANIYSNINIGSIQVYNRALTAAEVLQNYNATK
jgi:hypothetical protein